MTNQEGAPPTHQSSSNAPYATTRNWGDRLEVANNRYDLLDGELPSQMGRVAIAIVDGNTEPPETFEMLNIYDRQHLSPHTFGTLLYVNYQGDTPPDNTYNLLDAIREQRERTTVPTAIALVGYHGTRRIDRLRNDAWDLAVAHTLRHPVDHPVIGISNDADMVDISPDYIPSMTQNGYIDRPATVWGSEVVFNQPGGSDLLLHKLVAHLNGNRQLMRLITGKPVIYGASLALTLDTYVASGGWTGVHTEPNPYGRGEPSRLILNAWEKLTRQEGSMDDTRPAYAACARRVAGTVTVSPRREVLAYAYQLGQPDNVITHLDTESDNPYRGLSDGEIAELASSVSPDDPAVRVQLDVTDQLFLDNSSRNTYRQMRRAQRALREDLGLPPSTRF